MKKFIRNFVVFLLCVTSLAYIIDYSISHGLSKMEDYRFQTWNDIVNSNINADLIVMCNSRAFSHYSPAILDSVLHMNTYNIGIGGHPFNVQYLRYKLYRRYNKKPKIIIQNIDFLTLTNSRIGHEREQLFPYIQDSFLRNQLSDVGYSNLEMYIPLYRYFGYSMVIKNGLTEFSGLKHYNHQPSIKGYRPEAGKWDGTELSRLERIKPVMDTKTIRLFEKFLMECRNEHITVFLVNSPLYVEASRKMEKTLEFKQLIQSFSEKYKFQYLDYSTDSICSDSSLFHVAVHLNQNGANIFTRKLAIKLKSELK